VRAGQALARRRGDITGRGVSLSGPRRNYIERGMAFMDRCTLFFKGGLGWCPGRGRQLPGFFARSIL